MTTSAFFATAKDFCKIFYRAATYVRTTLVMEKFVKNCPLHVFQDYPMIFYFPMKVSKYWSLFDADEKNAFQKPIEILTIWDL